MPQIFEEKAAQARALIEEVRTLNAEGKNASGIDSGEKATTARKKMAEAMKLAGEAKAARAQYLESKSAALLDAFDSGTAHAQGEENILNGRKSDGNVDEMSWHKDAKETLVISKKDAALIYGKKFARNLKAANMKVLAEDTPSTGGYLVVPEYHQEMFADIRLAGNALRSLGWVNVHQTRSNKILIPTGAGAVTMGWTAENQPSPSSDKTFGQIEVDVHEASGIAKTSLSLYEDGDPSGIEMSIQELAKRAAILEEQAWINGDGSGKAYGILNTSGVLTTTFASLTTQQEQLDAILDMASAVLTNYFAPVTGVLVAPRRYAFWLKAKDSAGNYLFNPAGQTRAPAAMSQSLYDGGDVLGIRLGQSPNIPLNLGGGTNEDRIIGADWSELHAFIRRDLTIDTSTEADGAFSNRQVHVRLTFRQGSTAGRYPTAFNVGGGDGLAV